jgi:cytochrome c5
MRVLPILVSIFILFAVSMTFVVVDSSTAAEKVDLEAAKGTFEETCSKCHATSRALGKKKDQAGWVQTVSRMAAYHERQKGAPVSEEDQNAIVHYLVEMAGK